MRLTSEEGEGPYWTHVLTEHLGGDPNCALVLFATTATDFGKHHSVSLLFKDMKDVVLREFASDTLTNAESGGPIRSKMNLLLTSLSIKYGQRAKQSGQSDNEADGVVVPDRKEGVSSSLYRNAKSLLTDHKCGFPLIGVVYPWIAGLSLVAPILGSENGIIQKGIDVVLVCIAHAVGLYIIECFCGETACRNLLYCLVRFCALEHGQRRKRRASVTEEHSPTNVGYFVKHRSDSC